MLRIIEYGLLAVSLLVVIGLIVSGSRSRAGSTTPSAGLDDDPEAQEQGKTS
jgi:hypothetical protein